MKSNARLCAVPVTEGIQVDLTGNRSDLSELLSAVMAAFLKSGVADPHGLFCLVSSAVLVVTDD